MRVTQRARALCPPTPTQCASEGAEEGGRGGGASPPSPASPPLCTSLGSGAVPCTGKGHTEGVAGIPLPPSDHHRSAKGGGGHCQRRGTAVRTYDPQADAWDLPGRHLHWPLASRAGLNQVHEPRVPAPTACDGLECHPEPHPLATTLVPAQPQPQPSGLSYGPEPSGYVGAGVLRGACRASHVGNVSTGPATGGLRVLETHLPREQETVV